MDEEGTKETRDAAQQAADALEQLHREKQEYKRLYLQERITGLTAQILLAQNLREQAEAELAAMGG